MKKNKPLPGKINQNGTRQTQMVKSAKEASDLQIRMTSIELALRSGFTKDDVIEQAKYFEMYLSIGIHPKDELFSAKVPPCSGHDLEMIDGDVLTEGRPLV